MVEGQIKGGLIMTWDWGSCFIGIFIGAMGVLVSGMLAEKKEDGLPVEFCSFCKEQMCAACELIVSAHGDVKALDEQNEILQRSNAALRRDNENLYRKLYADPSKSRLLWDLWA
jgi:hypothetical protein